MGLSHYTQKWKNSDIDISISPAELVMRGYVPNASGFHSYGEDSTGLTGSTNRIIWPLTADILPLVSASGVALSIVSDSAQDAAAGTGARTILLHYLDANLAAQTLTVTMTGTTPVDTTTLGVTDVRWINCVHVVTAGTDRAVAGNINITGGGDQLAYLPAGEVRCSSSIRRVPAGYTGYICGIVGSSIGLTSATRTTIRVVSSYAEGVSFASQGILVPFGTIGLLDNSQTMELSCPFVIPEGEFVGFVATSVKDAFISADLFGWMEKND